MKRAIGTRALNLRSLIVVLSCIALAAVTPASAQDSKCPKICSSTEIWGFGGQSSNFAECICTDDSTSDCNCGKCYKKQGTHVIGYDYKNGVCTLGVDCANCEGASSTDSASASASGTPTPTPTTAAPTSTNPPATATPTSTLTPASTPPGNASSSVGNPDALPDPTIPTPSSPISSSRAAASASSSRSSSGSTHTIQIADISGAPVSSSSGSSAGGNAGNAGEDDSGIQTWQIALIICSCVLVFGVVVMSIMSCYCKTRERMKDNMVQEDETEEYQNYWHPGGPEDRAMPHQMNNSGFGASLTQTTGRASFSSTHSRPNSTKNMPYSEPTYAMDNGDRIPGMGRPGRPSVGSTSDLPHVFNAFPPRDRPSHEVGHPRRDVAIEL